MDPSICYSFCFPSLCRATSLLRLFCFFILSIFISSSVVFAATIFVPDDYDTIQEAINASSPGDTVSVAAGTYNGNILFPGNKKNITLISENGAASTVIYGDHTGSVVTFATGINATLDGFTITNGLTSQNGGGIRIGSFSSPIIDNCIITDNEAFAGGGISCGDSSTPWITNSIIQNNSVTGDNDLSNGGGIHLSPSASPTITNCIIKNNTSNRNGAGLAFDSANEPIITNCTFSNNTAAGNGGAITFVNSAPIITNCTFSNNTVAGNGGAITFVNSAPIITNCTFSNNTVAGKGGAISFTNSAPIITNCTFSNNSASGDGGAIACSIPLSGTAVANSILWGDSPDEISCDSEIIPVTYSDIQGETTWPGTGNINADPKFVDEENGDFHLLEDSPCIDAGDNSALALPATDIDGDDRKIDDPAVADTGNGTPPIVDIGPYEWDAPLVGDINNDGNVNLADAILAIQVMSNIAPPVPVFKAGDINGDEKIGLAEAIYALQVVAGLTFIQKNLEGIWYTENRYFFIGDTGQLTNVEPISTEIIYDFSGAFIVENKNITGTIYLDHQHSGDTRHNHNINYSGTIVDFDEIDVDWDVPGAGTGSEAWRRISYTGSTEKALIDAENALILATGVEQSINPVDNLIIYYLTGTPTTVDEVIVGSCGGNANIYGIIDAQTGEFAGTLQYINFCDEDTGEYTLNGPAEFTGYTNLENHRPFRFQYYFGDVAFDRQNVSFAIRGRKGFNFTISPRSMILSYVFTDKNTGINYWLKDYINRLTHVENYGDISSAIGKYYDPNYGYVEISVGETIRKYDGDEWPSSGKLLLTGAVGSNGGNTKIRVSYLNKAAYQVEADTDGDGAYDDYNSGILLFSELP